MYEIILNVNGCTFRHPKAAKIGDLWNSNYAQNRQIVGITWISGNGTTIKYQPMKEYEKEVEVHASFFYSQFKRIEH